MAGKRLSVEEKEHSGPPFWRNILMELLGGLFAAALIACYGIGPEALTLFLAYSILTVIALVDIDTRSIPPILNVLLAVIGALSIFTLPGPTLVERIIGIFCISVPMYLVVLIIPEGFGGGDIKMMAATGLLLGWKANTAAFLIALLLGGGYGIYLLAVKKKSGKEHFAFGPFLSIGTIVAAYGGFGRNIVDMYIYMIQAVMVI